MKSSQLAQGPDVGATDSELCLPSPSLFPTAQERRLQLPLSRVGGPPAGPPKVRKGRALACRGSPAASQGPTGLATAGAHAACDGLAVLAWGAKKKGGTLISRVALDCRRVYISGQKKAGELDC